MGLSSLLWETANLSLTLASASYFISLVADFYCGCKKSITYHVFFFFFKHVFATFYRCRLPVRHLLHVRAEKGHQDSVAGPGQHRPDVGASAPHVATQRASLWRLDRVKQGRDGCQARRGSSQSLEALVRHPSPSHACRPRLLRYHRQGKIGYLQSVRSFAKGLCPSEGNESQCTSCPTVCTKTLKEGCLQTWSVLWLSDWNKMVSSLPCVKALSFNGNITCLSPSIIPHADTY